MLQVIDESQSIEKLEDVTKQYLIGKLPKLKLSAYQKIWVTKFYMSIEKDVYLTMSPNLTLRLFRTHLLILILSLLTVSSESTMQTVSRLRFPFNNTVSPLNNCNSSIFACESETTELSSFTASSTHNLFGLSLVRRIAVSKSGL